MTLGVFDSGLGGTTVLRRLRELLPHTDFVYFADQLHVPYGDRSDHELRALLAANVGELERRGAAAIVMGCNTSCAIAARYGWPPSALPIFDLIDAAADDVARSGRRRIGVLATAATARSGAYGRAIHSACPDAAVTEVAAPALVPLVEAGIVDGPRARDAVAQACAPFGGAIDAIVLACTHFPLLDAAFAEVLPGDVVRIDPADPQARRAASWVHAQDVDGTSRRGRTRYVTSGDPRAFRAGIAGIMRVLPGLDELEDAEEEQHGKAPERDAGDDLRGRVRLEVHP